jgi:hypothetical protein
MNYYLLMFGLERQWRIPTLLLLGVLAVRANVTLPEVLGEHMVLQRGLPVHIWGAADPGESVAVEFRGETRTATRMSSAAGPYPCLPSNRAARSN